jgi:DNA-binding NarL/FixJ family response regulator
LTAGELDVLGCVVAGWINEQIAVRSRISRCMVAAHLEHILGKLGVASRGHAGVRAHREGLYVPMVYGNAAAAEL